MKNETEVAFMEGASWILFYLQNHDGASPTRVQAREAAELYATRRKEAIAAARPKPKAKPGADIPPGWGEAAWEFHLAAKRAKTYNALNVSNLNSAAQGICARRQAMPAPINTRFWFPHAGEDLTRAGMQNAASTELVKAGVPGEVIIWQTKEAAAHAARMNRLSGMRIHLTGIDRLSDPAFFCAHPDPYLFTIDRARELARDLFEHGEREEARELVSKIRQAKATIRARFGSLNPHFRKVG